ncbi:MAG: hypothetical protein WCQ20_13245 [Synechococcaceae cyanobacterium ELA739]
MDLALKIEKGRITQQHPFALDLACLQAQSPQCRSHTATDRGLIDAIALGHVLAGSQPEQGVKRLQQVCGDQNALAFIISTTIAVFLL